MSSTQEIKVYGVSVKGMRQTMGDTLVEIGQANDKVVVVDCETATVTFASTFAKAFPDRFVQLGVAEQNAVSFAAGLSTLGFVPILPLFGCFSSRRANDQIHTQVAYPRFNVKVMGCYSGLTSPNTGATHQTVQDVAMMRSLPNMVVVEPADEFELRPALIASVAYDGPVYFRMTRGDADGAPRVEWPADYEFRLGKATVLREGADITLVGSGLMVSRCVEAAAVLSARGVSAEVINVSTIKPLDEDLIVASARKTGAVVTAENHSIIGGLGSAVAETLGERCPVHLRRVGIVDRFGESGALGDLLEKLGLTTQAVLRAADDLLEQRAGR